MPRTPVAPPLRALLAALILAAPSIAAAAAPEIALEVDARRAAQGVFHSHLVIPAVPGPLTLTYPKWIPGEHSPTGPIEQLVGLVFSAGGRPLSWRRDAVDMFSFHLTVPAGASAVEADFDYLSPQEAFGGGYGEGPNATEHLLVVVWNQQVLVPQGVASDAVTFRPTVRLPAGWKYDSALETAADRGEEIEFAPVTLTALVDSPLLAGERFRSYVIAPGEAPVRLSVAADDPADVVVPAPRLDQLRRVVGEAQALFGARHYRRYVWLVALTASVDPNGLEHPESSDDRLPPRVFSDEEVGLAELRILPHEYVHSWNGKFRRSRGLATPDYSQPMDGELLWIYEGLTRYLGDVVLATRAGLRPIEQTRDYLAWMASTQESSRPGRRWRPLVDTAISVQTLANAPTAGSAVRRTLDYYEEAALVWLEADLLIRQRSNGKRSLDDFCRRFAGPPGGPPALSSYTLDDVLATLAAVEAFDWRGFFAERVYTVQPHAPLGGIAAGGWRLVYSREPNLFAAGREKARGQIDWTYGLGVKLDPDGKVLEVVADSPAAAAGLVPHAKLVGVDGASWSPEALRAALDAAVGRSEPMRLLVERDRRLSTLAVDFHAGALYPHLERLPGAAERLSKLLAPRAAKS
ncbi:MAG: hypothetical protein U0X73_07425 [Thermoanaerobaculia bacterium]